MGFGGCRQRSEEQWLGGVGNNVMGFLLEWEKSVLLMDTLKRFGKNLVFLSSFFFIFFYF